MPFLHSSSILRTVLQRTCYLLILSYEPLLPRWQHSSAFDHTTYPHPLLFRVIHNPIQTHRRAHTHAQAHANTHTHTHTHTLTLLMLSWSVTFSITPTYWAAVFHPTVHYRAPLRPCVQFFVCSHPVSALCVVMRVCACSPSRLGQAAGALVPMPKM